MSANTIQFREASFYTHSLWLMGTMAAVSLLACGGKPRPPTVKSGFLAVVHKQDGTASYIDRNTRRIVSTFKVGYLPHEIAYANDPYIYVTNYGNQYVTSKDPSNVPGNALSVINLKSKQVNELKLGQDTCAPHGIVSSKDGRRLYVTCENLQKLFVVDTEDFQVSHAISTKQEYSHLVAISSDEARAYVANVVPGTVSVIDLIERKVLKIINTGAATEGICVSLDGRTLYVAARRADKLLKIDTSSLEIIREVKTDRGPIRVMPTLDGKHLLVNNYASKTVQVFDADSLVHLRRIAVGNGPIGMVIPDFNYAYVANIRENTISEIDLRTWSVTAIITAGGEPDGLTYIPPRVH